MKEQFALFIEDDLIKKEMEKYSMETRLDDLYGRALNGRDEYHDLWRVIKLCLILSHGNASVESGFSVNEQLLVENLEELSIISERLLCDYILSCGGPLLVLIDKPLLKAVRGSCQRYKFYLEDQRKEKEECKKRKFEKERITSEITTLKKRKDELEVQSSVIDKKISFFEGQL